MKDLKELLWEKQGPPNLKGFQIFFFSGLAEKIQNGFGGDALVSTMVELVAGLLEENSEITGGLDPLDLSRSIVGMALFKPCAEIPKQEAWDMGIKESPL